MIREQSAEENNELVVYKEEIQLLTITSNLWSCTFQTAVGYLCLDLVMAITLHFVQLVYLDQSQAANGVGLAYTIMMMLIMPISLGLNQSLNLHAARALGMNKIQLSRNYLNLTMYIHLVYYFPFCFLIYLLKDSFKFLIMDNPQETIDYAWQYLVFLVVSCVFANQFEAFKAYMIACKVYTPFIVIHIITTSLHWIYCYILIVVIDLKIQGACYAILITEISNCVLLSIYFMFSEDQKHLSGLTFKFQFTIQYDLLKSYIKSSFHLVIHIYADLFCFFALTALAVALSTNQLAAQIIFSNFSLIYFRFPFSLSLALLSYIGSEMPQNNIQTAKKYAGVGMALFLVYLLLFCLFTWIFQSQWAAFYAPGNQEIQYILLDSLPYFLIVYMFFDGAQVSISGILKGILKAEFVTISTLISYYVFGIPFISYLMYDWGLGLGIKGIWIGFGLANAVLLILYIILCFTTNWKEQANLIQMKVNNQDDLLEIEIDKDEDQDDDEKKPLVDAQII